MSNGLYISRRPPQDGTSQKQRMPKALHPDYIRIDERSREELLAFARALAAEISYYNTENQREGNWEAFFTEEVAENEPHKALFLAFLELFNYAQEHLNTLTRRHLEFYYGEVLRLKEKPATPDQVHVLFQLAKNIKSHLLQAGTLLKAGKDKNGVPLYYATEKDIVVNRAEIGELKTLFIAENGSGNKMIRAASVADSADGLGAPFEEGTAQWEIFGSPEKGEQAAIGFAIASPLLFLKEGERKIDILFTFTENLSAEVNELVMADTFSIQLSGAEGWIQGTLETYSGNPQEEQMGLSVSFDTAQPAITAYNKEMLGGRFNTSWPLMKILLKDHDSYDLLYALELVTVDLTVSVTGAKDLVLQNDQGTLDPARSFLPFGARPVLTSSFYIGSSEIFQKKLTTLTINIDWLDAPENLGSYYEAYDNTLTASDFDAHISLLYKKSWIPLLLNKLDESIDPDFKLFGVADEEDQQIGNGETLNIPGSLDAGVDYNHNSNPQKITKYDQNTQTGFIKIDLAGPSTEDFSAFGHAAYPQLYTQRAIALSKYDVPPDDPGYNPPSLPSEPYTPAIKSLSLDYTSAQTINFMNTGADRTEKFFHIRPFGYSENLSGIPSLLPQYPDEGTLYIGIKDLEPPQQLSILFRPAEGSAAPDNELSRENIEWSYLSGAQWKPLDTRQILSDTTKAFQATGIIRFNIPSDASLQHNLMPGGLHWLRAAVKKDATGAGKFIALHTQAVIAGFTDRDNDPSRLDQALGAQSISALAEKQPAVKNVTQPYPSFNGKAAEQHDAFYTRISERLRHKARAVSGWDYERLVLEKFPSIYKVKCLNHTEDTENRAGYITLVTLPGPEHKNAADPLEPKTSNKTLTAIGEYIQKYNSPFVKVDVKNPRYEQLLLRFKVRFTEGADQGYYRQLLEEEIIRFLSPWAYEDEEDIVFGNQVYKSAVLDFVEKRPYVDFVTDFVLYHIFEAELPAENEHHPIEGGGQNVYYILHYPNTLSGEQIALDFVVGFNAAIPPENINVSFIDDFRAEIDSLFSNYGATAMLQRADIIKHIEGMGGVDFLLDFRFFFVEDTRLKEDTERAVAARQGAILTSNKTHDITIIDMNSHQCPGVENIGINYMVVQGDFIVS